VQSPARDEFFGLTQNWAAGTSMLLCASGCQEYWASARFVEHPYSGAWTILTQTSKELEDAAAGFPSSLTTKMIATVNRGYDPLASDEEGAQARTSDRGCRPRRPFPLQP
jgi:hypothetical protein